MTRNTTRGLLFALLLCLVSTSLPVVAQQPALRIAVANPQRILNEMQETRELKQKLEAETRQIQANVEERQRELRSMKEALDQLKPGTPQYDEKNKELRDKVISLQTYGQVMQQETQRTHKMQLKSLFEKIEQATGEIARQKGLDIVLTDLRQDLDNFEQMTTEQAMRALSSRNVLYASPQADISADVIAYLDARYREKK